MIENRTNTSVGGSAATSVEGELGAGTTEHVGEPGKGPQQQQPTEEVADAREQSAFQRFGHAAGRTFARATEIYEDPGKAKKLGADLLQAAKDNPDKVGAGVGIALIGPSTIITTAVVGGIAAAVTGAVRTGMHMADGNSLSAALTKTGEEAADIRDKATKVGTELAAEARKLWGDLFKKGGE